MGLVGGLGGALSPVFGVGLLRDFGLWGLLPLVPIAITLMTYSMMFFCEFKPVPNEESSR